MKRVNNIYYQITLLPNIMNMYDKRVKLNTRNKNKIEKFDDYYTENIINIKNVLESKSYKGGKYNLFVIKEPKVRLIMSQNISDKVINHLVSQYFLVNVFDSSLIDENVSTRIGKGSHYGIKLLKQYINELKDDNFYVLRFDINKYFFNLDHNIIKKLIRRKIKDKDALEIIDINPFDRIKNKPKVVSKPKDYFNEDEMHYIHDMVEFENIRFRTLIVLMMDTGMRREESLAIKYSDINIIRKTLSISRAFVYLKANGQAIVKPTKTASSVREIFLTNHAMELIQNMRKFKEACGFIVNDDDYVFTAWDSMELVNPNGFSREFKAFLEKIGMKKIIPLKNLRTTNTTFYIARGQNIKAVQKHAGHSSFDTTMTFYAQSDLSEDRKLTNIYEEEFYNKLGLSVSDIYRIISNRFDDHKKLTSVLEKLTGEYIDSSNFDIQLERCQEYFTDLFPIFDKILKIDNLLNDDDIDCLFEGYKSRYLSIKIEPLPPMPKL